MAPHTSKPLAKTTLMQIGDAAFVQKIMTTSFWKRLWSDYENAILSLIPKYCFFISSLSSYCMISLFRYKFDSFNTGFGATLFGFCFIITFNSGIWLIVKPFFVFLLPIIALFFLDIEIWIQFTFVKCHSLGLAIYSIVFFLCSLFHALRIYFYKDDNLPKEGRGYSLLHLLLSKFISIQEFWVNMVIEPVLFICLGILMYYLHDYYFAFFLWLCSLNEIWIQVKLKVYELNKKKLENI